MVRSDTKTADTLSTVFTFGLAPPAGIAIGAAIWQNLHAALRHELEPQCPPTTMAPTAAATPGKVAVGWFVTWNVPSPFENATGTEPQD